ncbi:unnamed protein product [Soboliphyme baturini]|uniref:BED-type domain-containing protein n=1 Tax=Soboliphyme baturini TaxID=241478 RepID=A0A183JB88_9BILA|nr:unnamed protein product [Soboliphyme baturini]
MNGDHRETNHRSNAAVKCDYELGDQGAGDGHDHGCRSIGKEVAERLVMQRSLRVEYFTPCSSSRVWQSFDRVRVDGNDSAYAICKYCRAVLTYRPRSGTSSLRRHRCHMSE